MMTLVGAAVASLRARACGRVSVVSWLRALQRVSRQQPWKWLATVSPHLQRHCVSSWAAEDGSL